MRRISHPVYGILIICLLILPMALSFIALQHQKASVKQEVREMLEGEVEKEKLTVLNFSRKEAETELEWVHEREFRYKGMMYDVVSTEVRSDSVSYVCWKDEKETGIDSKLDHLVTQWMDSNPVAKEKQQRLLTFYFQVYDLPVSIHSPVLPANELEYNSHISLYCGEYVPTPTPPPRRLG